MLQKGTTFIRSGHVWFHITERTPKNPSVLCVNLTCLDDQCPDDECHINKSEYSWVRDGYATAVAFSRARIWNGDSIEKCLRNGLLSEPHQEDVPKSTVLKVIKAALSSRELNADCRALLK